VTGCRCFVSSFEIFNSCNGNFVAPSAECKCKYELVLNVANFVLNLITCNVTCIDKLLYPTFMGYQLETVPVFIIN